jgi:hypothetical protein
MFSGKSFGYRGASAAPFQLHQNFDRSYLIEEAPLLAAL